MSNPNLLVDLGIWPENSLKNWDFMQSSPRYFQGRQLLVKHCVDPLIESPQFMRYDKNQSNKFVTHNAILVGKEENDFIVEI